MKASSLRTLFVFCALSAATSGQGLRPPPFATYTFGLSLNTGPNNQLFTLFTVKEFEGRTIQADPLTRDQFVLQAQGVVPSPANPEGINLFRKYDVRSCLAEGTDTSGRYLLDCEVFDRIWKLRFQEYPFRPVEGQHPGKGWAEEREAPSPRQLLLLTDYGMLHRSDLAKGENVFRLLHDVGDSAWVDNYRKGL
ncbi:MAG TPA: hypothetical protein PLB89_18160 [Flavobacteriales bacterium]|nr:hypothetical protein [Flavobacteriales bacterium]